MREGLLLSKNMGIFSIFKPKRKNTPPKPKIETYVMSDTDYIGKAAYARDLARLAEKSGKYKKAWRHYHEEKSHFSKLAKKNGYTAIQTLALDASVHEKLADILRKEKKHNEALYHILYWIIAQREKPKKSHQQKLKAYFNRCKFVNTNLDEARTFVRVKHKRPTYDVAKSVVKKWQSRE